MSPWQREAPLEEEEEEFIKVSRQFTTQMWLSALERRMHVTMLFSPFFFRSLCHGYGHCAHSRVFNLKRVQENFN